MSQVLSKYSKIAIAENKLKAFDEAMKALSEDTVAISAISAVRSVTVELPVIKYKRIKKAVTLQIQPPVRVRTDSVEMAREVYGKRPADKPMKQIQASRRGSVHDLVERYLSMDVIDTTSSEVTAEMQSLLS